MRRKLPPLNALLAFEAAARAKSFTRGAVDHGVAQPAITRHVRNLEDWLGTDLFKRHGNGVELTPEGQAFADHVTRGFDLLEVGTREVTRQRSRELIIGASFGVMHLWLMPRIAAMRTATPTTINFLTADDYRSFDTSDVDLSIRFGNGHFPGYESDLLFAEECAVLASPDFLARHPELDPDNLCDTLQSRFLLDYGDPHGVGWMTWARWLDMNGAAPNLAVERPEIRAFPALLDMVAAGEGLAIGARGFEDTMVRAGSILRLGPPVGRDGHGYYLVYQDRVRKKVGFDRLRRALLGSVSAPQTTP